MVRFWCPKKEKAIFRILGLFWGNDVTELEYPIFYNFEGPLAVSTVSNAHKTFVFAIPNPEIAGVWHMVPPGWLCL